MFLFGRASDAAARASHPPSVIFHFGQTEDTTFVVCRASITRAFVAPAICDSQFGQTEDNFCLLSRVNRQFDYLQLNSIHFNQIQYNLNQINSSK